MKAHYAALLVGLLVLGGWLAVQPVSAGAVDLEDFEGQWSGAWRSSRGNTGMISVTVKIADATANKLEAEFAESGLLVTKWKTVGQVNDKSEVVFEGQDRTDILRLQDGGKVLRGTYQWKTKSSTGTTEFRKK